MTKYVYLVCTMGEEDPIVICETEELANIAVDHLHKIDEILEFPRGHYWWTKMLLCDSGNQVRNQLN